MVEAAVDMGGEVDLLRGVAANRLAYGEGTPPRGGQVDRSDQAVETARKKNDAIGVGTLGRLRRGWLHAASVKTETPYVGRQESDRFREVFGLGVPERGIRNSDIQIELPGPSVRAQFAQARIVRRHHRKRYRKQIPGSRCRLQPAAQELVFCRVASATSVDGARLAKKHDAQIAFFARKVGILRGTDQSHSP
ncbi:MAG: hypothetical protein NT113_01400 [Hyphomicrobiales bacterium]|nr:hypothetical protein [Hyphomicrobiales bacterium]